MKIIKKSLAIILTVILAFSIYIEPTSVMTKAENNDQNELENYVIITGSIEADDGTGVVRWTKDKTYVICSYDIVEAPHVKCKLIIEPGTTILFGTGTGGLDGVENSEVRLRPYSIFRVDEEGSIDAKGTKEEPITFKNISTHAGWNGIEITLPESGEVTDTFEYCNFINGGAQFRDFTEGLIDVSYGTEKTKFKLVVDHCTFDSTELINRDVLQPSEVQSGIYYGDHSGNTVQTNIKITNSTFRSLSMAIETCKQDEYNNASKCIIENNVFENNMEGAYKSSVIWHGNAEVRNNTFYTTRGGSLERNACDLAGRSNYVIEGNTFYGSQSVEKDKMNKEAPIRVQFGANINADTTKTYKENICDYSSPYGKYVQLNGESKTAESYIGNIPGLKYYLKDCGAANTDGGKSLVTFEPGLTMVADSLLAQYGGSVIAKGTKEKPIRFVGDWDLGVGKYNQGQVGLMQSWRSATSKAQFENCEFDDVCLIGNITSETEKPGYDEQISTAFTVKNCTIKNARRGLSVSVVGDDTYIGGKAVIENVKISAGPEWAYQGVDIHVRGSNIPDEKVVELRNCTVYGYKSNNYDISPVGLNVYIEEGVSSDVASLENITVSGGYIGVSGKSDSMKKLPIIRNAIIAGNEIGFDVHDALDMTKLEYSCIYNESKDAGDNRVGEGCIFKDPLFANLEAGDLHLKSKGGRWDGTKWVADTATSPCINAGNPSSDYSKEPAPNGNRVNIGAYGNTAEASKTDDGTFVPGNPETPTSEVPTTGSTNNNGSTTQTPAPTQKINNPVVTEGSRNEKLKTPAIKKMKKASKKIKITFKKIADKNPGYYEIQYSTNRKFKKGTKTLKVNAKKTKATIKKLKGKKKYYVRVRLYKNVAGIKLYSSWTKTKSIKTKR